MDKNKDSSEEISDISSLFKKYKTKGYHKLENYFQNTIRKEPFLKEVRDIRIKYKIFENGYDNYKTDGLNFIIPYYWPYLRDNKKRALFNKDIQNICKEFGLTDPVWENVLMEYIFYNKTNYIHTYPIAFDVCFLENYGYQDTETRAKYKKENKIDDEKRKKMYPIVLRISPEASGKEIIDFVKKYDKFIKSMQERFKEKMGLKRIRGKKPNLRERNDYIFNLSNEGKSLKEISSLTADKFEKSPDEGSIGKIISLEKKRRK